MSNIVLGLDIASSTGWCILKDNQLVKYGVITIPSTMDLFQRIKYFENNLIQILNDNNPNEVHIEDVILGISGAKTLAYLARLNGVAISTCYNKVGNNIKLYTPVTWKSHSFPNLNGMAKKVEIQIAVIKHFGLISENELKDICKPLNEFDIKVDSLDKELQELKKSRDNAKQILSRKKSTIDEKNLANETLKSCNNKISINKSQIKKIEKEIEKVQQKVSLSLTAKCGLTSDISDSIGIAYCNM